MLKFKLWKFVACVAVLVAGAGRGEAATVSLASLLTPGATLVSGDKVFSNFHNFTETGTATPLGAANILLTTISQPNRDLTDPFNWPLPPGQPRCGNPCSAEYGFRVSGPFGVGQNQHQNYGLDFTVTVVGGCKLYAAEQEVTARTMNGTAESDTNITYGLMTLAVLGTFVHDPGFDNTLAREYFTSSLTGHPLCLTTAHVSMGWFLGADNMAGAEAVIDHFDTYFAQGSPEPSTYVLLVVGSAGMGLMLRRQRT
jgi:hypothetical protein